MIKQTLIYKTKMNDRINQTILSCLILLFTSISIINAQDKNDWSQVYADKYFFSYGAAKKSVIVYARRDTMIEVWIDGWKDTADYSESKRVNMYECWDNGVVMNLTIYSNYTLGIYSREFLGIESDYQVEPNIEPVTFGQCTFYDCTRFKEFVSFENLEPSNFLELNKRASYLIQIGDDQCYDCAISILEKIVNADSTLVAPLLNLADAYWDTESFDRAKECYLKYIELMKQNNHCDDIPSHVIERLSDK